jgi:hypothetical protein
VLEIPVPLLVSEWTPQRRGQGRHRHALAAVEMTVAEVAHAGQQHRPTDLVVVEISTSTPARAAAEGYRSRAWLWSSSQEPASTLTDPARGRVALLVDGPRTTWGAATGQGRRTSADKRSRA